MSKPFKAKSLHSIQLLSSLPKPQTSTCDQVWALQVLQDSGSRIFMSRVKPVSARWPLTKSDKEKIKTAHQYKQGCLCPLTG